MSTKSNSLLERVMKKGVLTDKTSVLAKSIYFTSTETIKTPLPLLNIAFSGSINGGLVSGISIFAGESKTLKTYLMLYTMKAYLDKYEDAIAILWDSETGATLDYYETIGIDVNRVVHIPIISIEELRADMAGKLSDINRGDHVFLAVDSIGMLASTKEISNAEEVNISKDMTRANELKSFFRIITPMINQRDIPCVMVSHVYSDMGGIYKKTNVSGGCVVADTMIKTNKGLVAIQNIKVGDNVFCSDNYHPVENIWNPETLENGNPECFEIEFDDGYKVICSDEHKFIVNNEWKKTKNITTYDNVLKSDNNYLKIKTITPVGKKQVYDIMVKDVHNYVLENGVISHNSGVTYSANQIFIITKSKETEGTDVVGHTYTIRIDKSRFVKEGSKLGAKMMYEDGFRKYSGLLDIALEGGFIVKPSMGWYSKANPETGEVEQKKYRQKEIEENDEFWESIINDPNFDEFIKKKFKLGYSQNLHTKTEVDKFDEILDDTPKTDE